MRTVFHVTPRSNGEWQAKKVNAKRASIVGRTKEDTIKRCVDLAKKKGQTQIIIHLADGRFQEERTYGNDPEKTPG